jgi:hypothetical protein
MIPFTVVISQENHFHQLYNWTLWPESASELYRLSHRYLSPKLVPTFADRRSNVVSVTDPYGRILGFLDRSRYFFFKQAHQFYSRGWVDLVPDPILLRKSGSAWNRPDLSICSQELWQLDHRGGRHFQQLYTKFHPTFFSESHLHKLEILAGKVNVDFDVMDQLLVGYSTFLIYEDNGAVQKLLVGLQETLPFSQARNTLQHSHWIH